MIYLLKWAMFSSCVILTEGKKSAHLEDPMNGFETMIVQWFIVVYHHI